MDQNTIRHIEKVRKEYERKVNWWYLSKEKFKIVENLRLYNLYRDADRLLEVAEIYEAANHSEMADFYYNKYKEMIKCK